MVRFLALHTSIFTILSAHPSHSFCARKAFHFILFQHGRICNANIATSMSASSWISCAQPRFDEFASCIVGTWITNQTQVSIPVREEVEEVMRSCGGAIQGIKEIPICSYSPGEGKERIYHNRADGGFIYADDGSYSAGPEEWSTGTEKLVMASLAFSVGRRLLMTVNARDISEMLDKEIVGMHQLPSSKVIELSRTASAKSLSSTSGDYSNSAIEVRLSQLSITWEVIKRVRMSTSDQAWSLTRAKWEKLVEQTGEDPNNDDSPTVNRIQSASLMGCSYIESVLGNADSLFGDIIKAGTINLHMLAICQASNVARSVVRCYDSNGSLISVAFLQGSFSSL